MSNLSISGVLKWASAWIISVISSLGYWGIFIGMFIESSSIPLPSEVIMGFAGYLVYKGELALLPVALVGALGNISGSTFMYLLGIRGGRPVIDKYGKYLHITKDKMDKVDRWFAKWGDELVFVAQLLPGVRTFISLPAGILKVNFPKFIIYTFLGAFLWCLVLAYTAYSLGEHWELLSSYIKRFEHVIFLGLVIVVGFLVYKWMLNLKKDKK